MKTILSIILLIIAIITGVFCAVNSPLTLRRPWLSLIAFIIFVPSLVIGLGLYQPVHPTKQDVIDNRAYYQESEVITGNDTIKTYDIVWKQKN